MAEADPEEKWLVPSPSARGISDAPASAAAKKLTRPGQLQKKTQEKRAKRQSSEEVGEKPAALSSFLEESSVATRLMESAASMKKRLVRADDAKANSRMTEQDMDFLETIMPGLSVRRRSFILYYFFAACGACFPPYS